jgi:hypothetical protein
MHEAIAFDRTLINVKLMILSDMRIEKRNSRYVCENFSSPKYPHCSNPTHFPYFPSRP